ncbi:flagellar filament capping protein FliD [Paenibacillus taiwanensis]|uniref:flagellar filament capping protein FliD n=1 Tax=Paenibacillus taiwanensis TaxID=401638 RepID=UPI000401C22E|nr:flagellar filament capping protein FliD [Paenibacillus taiwanensis]
MPGVGGPIRLSGLSSNMDIDKLVSDLMRAERQPLDKLHRQKQSVVWQREDYRSANTAFLNFRLAADEIRFEKTFNKTTATSSDDKVASISISNSSLSSSFQVKVDKVATSATVIGTAITADAAKPLNETGTIRINGVDINVTADEKIDSIVKNINAQSSKTGVQASFDTNSNRLMLMTKETGTNSKIELSLPSNLQNALKLNPTTVSGTDSEYSVNQGPVITSGSNSINVNGVQLQLKNVGQTSIGVESDTSGLVDKIKNFVNKYNEMVDKISSSVTTKRNRDYKPLTDEEKASMSEKQVEMWENKARQGILFSDPMLRGALQSLRSAMSTPLDGVGKDDLKMLSQIGIKASSDYRNNGKLEIDEKKLTDAINNRFDEVKQLFLKTSTTKPDTPEGIKQRRAELGIGDRLYEEVDAIMKKVTKKMGSATSLESMDESMIGKQLKVINDQEKSWSRRLQDIETRYYKKFTAMEKAMQKLNSQGSWLAQQLGQ